MTGSEEEDEGVGAYTGREGWKHFAEDKQRHAALPWTQRLQLFVLPASLGPAKSSEVASAARSVTTATKLLPLTPPARRTAEAQFPAGASLTPERLRKLLTSNLTGLVPSSYEPHLEAVS